MSAFNVVRTRVKKGYEDQFIDEHRKMENDIPGLCRFSLVKTGDRAYCFIGEWEKMEDIVNAREEMIAKLDKFRHMLEDLGGDLGVTDPVSGETIIDLKF